MLFECYFVDSFFPESMLQNCGGIAILIAEMKRALACISVGYEFSGNKCDFSRFGCSTRAKFFLTEKHHAKKIGQNT